MHFSFPPSFAQVKYGNCHQHELDLQSPKKMESDCDIIQQMCVSNIQNQMEITFKDETMSDFMDQTATVADASTDMNANETTTMDDATHRSHFVEIGEFSCGSIFGLGEHMDDRAIVAKHTQVQCLLIPHYWLFEKKQNTGNIWQRYKIPNSIFGFSFGLIIYIRMNALQFDIRRTKIYLNFTLPSRQEVFDNYLIARKWKSYKKQLIYSSQSRRPLINSTKVQDVPIICRLNNSF